MLSRVYKAAGFNSWLYNFGVFDDDDDATHITTLVEVDGGVILQILILILNMRTLTGCQSHSWN